MIAILKWWGRKQKLPVPETEISPFPHCDPRVLHAPGKCRYCDLYQHYQELRRVWNIRFTGEACPEYDSESHCNPLPCPSDYNRGLAGAHVWGGNRPEAKA